MTRILTSLHGRKIGLSPESVTGAAKGKSDLIVDGGFVSGLHGSQLHHPSPSTVSLFDDFLGDVLQDPWNAVEGSDTDATQAVLAGGIGGTLRLTSGNDDANGTQATDASGVTSYLNWQASNGGLVMQARIKVSRITLAYIFVGFTDVITAELPIISAGSADTLTSNATDAVGFMFDTNMTTDNWWLVGVATDVDATAQNTATAPVADDYETLRVEVSASGVATFFRNGARTGSAMTGAVTAAADLTPCVYVSNADGTSTVTLDIDYIHVAMTRAADGDAT
jgi:hypothetical protein